MARETTPGRDDQLMGDGEPEEAMKASLVEETGLPAEDVIGPELDG
jgi:hypothetical protein